VRVASVSLEEPKKRPTVDTPEVLALVTAHIDLVDIVARSTKRLSPRADFDDLVGAGREGLLGAARAFEKAHGVPFRSFASFRIRGAMMDYMRTSQNVSRSAIERIRAFEKAQQVSEVHAEDDAALPGPRSPEDADKVLAERLAASAAAMAIGLLMASGGDAIDAVADNVDVEERLEQRLLLGKIEKIMEERPEAERQILRLHYFEDLSLEEVGARLGLHKSWVSRVMTRAVEALGRRLGESA
jgi:RNA polymerase sigma factor FliA